MQKVCARAVNNIFGGDQGNVFAVLDRGVWTAVICELPFDFFLLFNIEKVFWLLFCAFTVWHCIVYFR